MLEKKMATVLVLLSFAVAVQSELPADCNSPCPEEYTPVCGSDGRTYWNLCELQVASCLSVVKINAIADMECSALTTKTTTTYKTTPELTTPSTTKKPTSTQKPTATVAVLSKATTTSAKVSTTVKPSVSTQQKPSTTNRQCVYKGCPSPYPFVCGSDYHSYACENNLEYWNCYRGTNVTVVHKGQCGKCQQVKCPPDARPVCGRNGKQYQCKEALDYLNCLQDTRIGILYEGQCCENIRRCYYSDSSVCGTDGKTYSCEYTSWS
ncbi:ovomucoid-like [Lingula anatina]|uniref:Ovomucoid-like n=1 Tax=Lingula anatina TaxID=7574 RepID=A0A1S3HQE1_LINAN|nr:ovomucoid-like [Lingula anatina]|eukprot:XP_013388273.1 ovomucoid-like [Lingula anatina]